MLEYSMLYPRTTAKRRSVSMDGMWKFTFNEKSVGVKENYKDGIPNNQYMPVPASFQDFFTDKDSREYCGDFWYETEVVVPSEWKGRQILIRFGAATHRAVVYVNGVEIMSHEGGFLPFCADITETAKYDEPNKVVVLVNNELTHTNIPVGETITLSNGKKMAKPYFDFFNYSGLQRSVALLALPKESIFDYTLNYRLDKENAFVDYEIITTGDHDICIELFDEEENLVTTGSGKNGSIFVEKVRLWEVRNAYLYKIVLKIINNNEVIDEYYDYIGIRTVEVKGTSILVNGKSVYLKGFGKHEDADVVGRGFSMPIMKRDFECMKWIGANSFRTSHYPYSEEIYQMADREGFMVIDEVAAVGLFESLMNFMEASTGKKTAFFEKPTTEQLLKTHLRAIEELITRDKNHACVIAWSLLNEPDTTNKAAVPYFKTVFEKAHEMDVQKRPRTFALIMNSVPGVCNCYQFADIIALNRYYGWYVKGGYELCDAIEVFRQEMDKWKELNLNKPFIFTEYGADTNGGLDKLPSVMWSQEYQKEYLDKNHEVFDSYDFVKGEQVWNYADFQTTEGILRMDGNKKGIFTRNRQPKAAAYYFKNRWENLPLNYKE